MAVAGSPGALYFRDMGAGPVLVFVHGLGVSSRYFVPLMRELCGAFRCVAPDLPGHGRSPGPALDIDGLAAALIGFLHRHSLTSVTLVANSLGCQVVAALVERHPESVMGMVFIAPTIDPATRDHFWRSLLAASVREPLPLLPILAWDYLRFGLRRFIRTIRYALADDIARRLPQLHLPALIVQGARDHIVTVPWATSVAAGLPLGELAVIADGAHAVHYSRPAAVAALVTSFRGRIEQNVHPRHSDGQRDGVTLQAPDFRRKPHWRGTCEGTGSNPRPPRAATFPEVP